MASEQLSHKVNIVRYEEPNSRGVKTNPSLATFGAS